MISNAISDSRSRLMEQNKLMLTTLKDVYRKFHLGHDNIGSEELMNEVLDTLCNVMGDDGYQVWMNKMTGAPIIGEK